MKLRDMDEVQKIRAINRHARKAKTFRGLDHCANLAREHGIWNYCVPDIHERNMTLLGKPGYGPAAFKKGWHIAVVSDEFATKRGGGEIHARELSRRGYRFIGTV